MKLSVKLVDAEKVIGRKAFVICGEDGSVLPQQLACQIEQQAGEPTLVTVTFQVDGKQVRIEG